VVHYGGVFCPGGGQWADAFAKYIRDSVSTQFGFERGP